MIISPLIPITQLTLSLKAIPNDVAKPKAAIFILLAKVGINSVPGPKRLKAKTPR